MARLYGKEMCRKEIMKRVNNLSKVASVTATTYQEGKAAGVRAYRVVNGSGLEFTVLKDKCLDIFELAYKGIGFNFLSKPGLTAPAYFDTSLPGFLHNFQGGMFYTCGLSNVGSGGVDEAGEFNQHGRIGSIPSEQTGVSTAWEGDEYRLEVSGQMREAALFNENLVLRRRVSTYLGARTIRIHDEVENQGFETQGLMLLYHFNLGYPLLDDGARFVAPSLEVKPRDADAEAGMGSSSLFTEPVDGYREQVFYHRTGRDEEGKTCAAIVNEQLGLGWFVRFNPDQLPRLIQWKSMKTGDYCLGIEPANCLVEGRAKERERGTLQTIEPFETRTFDLEIGVLDGLDEIREFEDKVRKMK